MMMNKKIILISSIILILIITLIFNINQNQELINYSDNPKDWIIETNNSKIISLSLATKGSSHIDLEGQQFRSRNISTVFDLYGYYQGNLFEKSYYLNGKKLIKITNDMIPNNNIIEGYVIFDIIDEIPTFLIFVDNDWKNKIIPTNIWWGFSQENKKEFNFTEISPGIYMDKITIDNSGFLNNYNLHLYKIFIGDMTEEKIISQNNNLTFIVIR